MYDLSPAQTSEGVESMSTSGFSFTVNIAILSGETDPQEVN